MNLISTVRSYLGQYSESRHLILLIVAVAILLDNMLLTTVVPIIPNFLYEIHQRDELESASASFSTTPLMARYGVSTIDPHLQLGPYLLQDKTAVSSSDNDTKEDNVEVTTLSSEAEEAKRHKTLEEENVEVGFMFASKPVMQTIVNPIIGPLTNRVGYAVPMFAGFVIMFISTLVFAVGDSYFMLFFARAIQGVGSACTSVAGMGMLADRYPDDRERGNAMAIAMGGLALGVMIGPPFGGIMYEFVSKSAPFLILAAITLLDGLLQLVVLKPRIKPEAVRGAPLKDLLTDPYILIATGSITFANLGIAVLEPSLPLWLMDTMHAPKWQQGTVFLPASISYLIGTNVFGPLGHSLGRWLSSMLGLVIIGTSLVIIPMATNVNHLILPNAGIGFAIGMVDSTMMPMLGHLVDIRHTSVYGSVYAIGDAAFCVGFVLGPLVSSAITKTLGFRSLVHLTAAVCFLYAPLLFMLRNPPRKNEQASLLTPMGGGAAKTATGYATLEEEDEDEETRKQRLNMANEPDIF